MNHFKSDPLEKPLVHYYHRDHSTGTDIRFHVTLADTEGITAYNVNRLSVTITDSTNEWLRETNVIIDQVENTNSFILELPFASPDTHMMEIQAVIDYKMSDVVHGHSLHHEYSPVTNLIIQSNSMLTFSDMIITKTNTEIACTPCHRK